MNMQRRTVGVIAAVTLALLGTLGLVGYVQGAKDRAVAGEKLVDVYVATDKISAGTPGGGLGDSVELEQVPAKVRADDAVVNLEAISGKVASVDLLAGEQLVKSRFVALDTLPANVTSSTRVPAGMFASTVSLEPEQALGGQVRAGNKVAVVATDTQAAALSPSRIIARNALVTTVQIDGDKGQGATKKEVTDAPTGKFLVTLALNQTDLEAVVAAVNHGKVWLATDSGTP